MNKNQKIQPIISFFNAPIYRTIPPYANITLNQVYQAISGPYYKKLTEKLRLIFDEAENRKYKTQYFDFVTFSGTFSKRNIENLIQLSGLMVLDLDHLKDLDAIKLQLLKDPFFETQLLFVSPNGDGLKWILEIDINEKYSHREWFDAISNYIKSSHGIEVDKTGSDVARACFLSFDPDAYLNPKHGRMNKLFPPEIYLVNRKKFDPKTWLQNTKKNKTFKPTGFSSSATRIHHNVDIVIRRIENYQIDITTNSHEYNDWRNLGFAFADEFGEAGRQYFHRISRFYPDYDIKATDNQFDKCLQSNRKGITIKTFFGMARDAGLNIRV